MKAKSKSKVIIKPDISLLLPVYNGVENYPADSLRRSIDSALSQTGVNVEVVVVVDCSTDNTGEILADYGDKITVINHDKRLGAGASLNTAADNATGKYFMQYSARAWLELDGLNRLMSAANNDRVFVYGMMRVHGVINRLHIPPAYNRAHAIAEYKQNFYMFDSEAYKNGARFRDYIELDSGDFIGVVDRDFLMQLIIDHNYTGIANTSGVIVHYWYSGENQGSVNLAANRSAVNAIYDQYWKGAK